LNTAIKYAKWDIRKEVMHGEIRGKATTWRPATDTWGL